MSGFLDGLAQATGLQSGQQVDRKYDEKECKVQNFTALGSGAIGFSLFVTSMYYFSHDDPLNPDLWIVLVSFASLFMAGSVALDFTVDQYFPWAGSFLGVVAALVVGLPLGFTLWHGPYTHSPTAVPTRMPTTTAGLYMFPPFVPASGCYDSSTSLCTDNKYASCTASTTVQALTACNWAGEVVARCNTDANTSVTVFSYAAVTPTLAPVCSAASATLYQATASPTTTNPTRQPTTSGQLWLYAGFTPVCHTTSAGGDYCTEWPAGGCTDQAAGACPTAGILSRCVETSTSMVSYTDPAGKNAVFLECNPPSGTPTGTLYQNTPSTSPTQSPSKAPSRAPSKAPSKAPTTTKPSASPTKKPTTKPSASPTKLPTAAGR